MAGILDFLGLGGSTPAKVPPAGVLSAPQTGHGVFYLDENGNPIQQPAATAAAAPTDTGNFWQTKNPDGTSSFLGGLIGYDPAQDQGRGGNRLGLFGAALQDAGANFGGHPADAGNIQMFMRQAKATQARKALAEAAGDPVKTKAALMQAAAAGVDPSAFIEAANYGKPVVEKYSADENVNSVDPLTGIRTPIQTATPRPITNGGQQFNRKTGAWEAIPGYVDQQRAIYGARAEAKAANTPAKAKAPGTLAIPHPSGLF